MSARVSVRYFALLRDHLRAQGVDTSQLLRVAGVEEARLERHDEMLHLADVESFLASSRRLTGRTDLGFEMGRLIKMTSHDVLGLGMLSCRNVDELLRLVARHYHLMTETFSLRYHRTPRSGESLYTPTTSMQLETLRFHYEAIAISHCTQLSLMLGDRLESFDVYLSMPQPVHIDRYRALGSASFHFDEHALPGVRIIMSAQQLDLPLPLADARALKQVDQRCETLGQRPPTGDSGWGDYVMMMLREARGELVTLEDLARRINVSARTVDRYLKKEKLQFRELAQQVRFERARELLRAPSATVAQVALSLGFSDAANFSRAFRRVCGVSPSEYQQQSIG